MHLFLLLYFCTGRLNEILNTCLFHWVKSIAVISVAAAEIVDKEREENYITATKLKT